MMRFELNGQEVTPNDILDFSLALNGETGQISLANEKLVFSDLGAKIVRDWIDAGKMFQDLPLKVWNEGQQVFNGFCDLQNGLVIDGDRTIETEVVSYDSFDWIDRFANSISFGVLYEEKHITDSDFEIVNYITNFKPDVAEAALSGMGIYTAVKGFAEMVKHLQIIIVRGLPEFNAGFFKELAKIVIEIAYLVALIIALQALLVRFIEALFPQRGTYKAMRVTRMCERLFGYFGLSFTSTIPRDMIIIPAKDGLKDVGIPDANSPIYNCGDFLTTLKQIFNADIKIVNGVATLKRWDEFTLLADDILKDNFNNQEDLLNRYTYNTDELVGNYNVFYQTDPSELNTLDGSTLAFQKSYTGVKGLTQIAIPFAQAKNKLTRTDLENDLGLIQRTIHRIVNLFGNNNSNTTTINSKLGALLVSKPVFNIDKIAFIRGRNIDTISASYWWDNWHYVNGADVNQWKQYDVTPVEMTFTQFRKLINNNYIIASDGKTVEVTGATYTPHTNTANIEYREKTKYAEYK